MSLWFYYQNSDRDAEAWSVATAEEYNKIIATAMRVTTTFVDRLYDGTNQDDVAYRGHFWMDIDHKHNLDRSIRDARAVVKWLESEGADMAGVELYASGTKGFHLCVPSKIFNAAPNRVLKYLPDVYKQMAERVCLATGVRLDMSCYCNARGRLLRLPNKQRADGRYKVPLTLEELRDLTEAQYHQFTQGPRPVIDYATKLVPSPSLTTLFEQSRKAADELRATRKKVVAIPSETLKPFGDNRHPRCIEWMTNNVNLSGAVDDIGNRVAMNVAAYINAVQLSEVTQAGLCTAFAKSIVAFKGEGSVEHNQEYVWAKVHGSTHLEFNCQANRKVFTGDPCEDCPVRTACVGAGSSDEGLVARDDGYYNVIGDSPRKVSNWIISPHEKARRGIFEVKKVGDEPALAALELDVIVPVEERRYTLRIEPGTFCNRHQFQAAIHQQIPSGIWLGTEHDINLLKLIATRESDDMEKIIRCRTLGINRHLAPEEGIDTWVYVEEEHSFNADRMSGTHRLTETQPIDVKRIRSVAMADPRAPADVDVLCRLLNSNHPQVVGMMLGWVVACHLKRHWIASGRPEFPLLHPYGSSSSGKTMSAGIYTALACADFTNGKRPSPAGGSTTFPLLVSVASTSTVPRVFDEINPQMITHQSRVTQIYEILRDAYNDQPFKRGSLAKPNSKSEFNGSVNEYPVSSPIVFCATQPCERSELKNRMVEVLLPKAHSKEHAENFQFVCEPDNHERLFKYAKLLVWEALSTTPEDVHEMAQPLYQLVPEGLVDRHLKNHVVVLLGLQHLQRTLQKHGFDDTVLGEVKRVQDGMLQYWHDNKDKMFRRQEETEILNFIRKVSLMAVAQDNRGYYGLADGTHFVLTPSTLYLNLDACFELLKNGSARRGKMMEYESPEQMYGLLEDEDYFIGFGPIPDSPSPREWLIMDAMKLEARGIKMSRFRR